jgi:hypothetical protein
MLLDEPSHEKAPTAFLGGYNGSGMPLFFWNVGFPLIQVKLGP